MLCGSFSKTLAPGMTLGWIEPGRWHAQVAGLKAATSGSQTAVLELPEGADSQALFEACLAEHVVIAPGGMFSSSDRYRRCIRLGVASAWREAERRALRRVGELACRLQRPARQAA